MTKKKTQSKLFWGLLGCGVLMFLAIPVIGILAAIAIPAFLRFTKQSKSAEAQMITRQLGTVVQSEYMVDCKFPPALAPSYDPATACNGEKAMNDVSSWPPAFQNAMNGGPTYFSYRGQQVDEDTYQIVGQTDFICGDEMHTVVVDVQVSGDCEVDVSKPRTENEFE